MRWRRWLLLCPAGVAALCLGQDSPPPPPSFEAAKVLPSGGSRPIPLAPGLLVSIYGEHLGPASSCQGLADTQHRETPSPLRSDQMFAETLIYPKQLCDTEVLVGGEPAGLLYVHEKQINFKVPQDVAVRGSTEVRVVYQGRSSAPVTLPLGLESAVLSLDSPATVESPVWLKISMPTFEVRYPFSIVPAWFPCDQVEVRRDGKLLPRIADLNSQIFGGFGFSGNICGSVGLPAVPRHLGRIPLHLQYRFDRPGTYEVRYRKFRPSFESQGKPQMQSEWTKIEVLPAGPQERARWLDGAGAHAPAGTAELLSDFLPGILGIPDKKSLEILGRYLYHSDRLVREYAMYGLTYWPAEEAEAAVARMARAHGPSDVVIRFLARRPAFYETNGDAIVERALPFLRSDSPVLAHGAVMAVSRVALAEHSEVSAALRARAETALVDAESVFATARDPQDRVDYASALGAAQDERASAALWDLIHRNIAREQALIALTWRRAPADLPKLVNLALGPARDRRDSEYSSLPYAVHRAYGDAALPYLETLLARSDYIFVRTQSARELALAGRPSGFAFIADAIDRSRSYRPEMIQFIRDQFAALRQADDAAILRYVQPRAVVSK